MSQSKCLFPVEASVSVAWHGMEADLLLLLIIIVLNKQNCTQFHSHI